MSTRTRAARHELRCRECRVTWRSWAARFLGIGGYAPRLGPAKAIWLGGPFRFGSWSMSRWAEWSHAFDIGPVRVLWGWRSPLEREGRRPSGR